MAKTNDDRLAAVFEVLEEFYGDTSVPISKTLEGMQKIQTEVAIKIHASEQDLADSEEE